LPGFAGNSGGALDLDWLALSGTTTVSTTAEVNRERVPGNFGRGVEKLFLLGGVSRRFCRLQPGRFRAFSSSAFKVGPRRQGAAASWSVEECASLCGRE